MRFFVSGEKTKIALIFGDSNADAVFFHGPSVGPPSDQHLIKPC